MHLNQVLPNQNSKTQNSESIDMIGAVGVCKLLIVDDDQIITDGISDFLSKLGYNCLTANDGKQAYELWLQNQDVEIILADIVMPVMGGLDLIRAVRERNAKVRIVILSGVSEMSVAIECIKLGANDYLEKPVRPMFVLNAIRDQQTELLNAQKERESLLVSDLLLEASKLIAHQDDTFADRLKALTQLISQSFKGRDVAILLNRSKSHELEMSGHSDPAKIGIKFKYEDTNSFPELMKSIIFGPKNNFFVSKVVENNAIVGVLCVSKKGMDPTEEEAKYRIFQKISSGLGFLFAILLDVLEKGESVDSAHRNRLTHLAMVGETSASMVHDIVNPLTVISLNVEKLQARKDLQPDVQIQIEKLVKNVRTMVNVVNTFNHLMVGVKSAPGLRTNISTMVDGAVASLDHKIQRNGAKVEIECSADEKVICVGAQIERVIANLLSNALDAIEPVENKTVLLRASRIATDTVIMEVLNYGPAIPEDVLAKIFNKFFTTKPIGKGTGLGLYIASNIIKEHNGELFHRRDSQQRTIFGFSIKEKK